MTAAFAVATVAGDLDELQQASSAATSAVGSLAGTVWQLDTTLDSATADWSGEAREAYASVNADTARALRSVADVHGEATAALADYVAALGTHQAARAGAAARLRTAAAEFDADGRAAASALAALLAGDASLAPAVTLLDGWPAPGTTSVLDDVTGDAAPATVEGVVATLADSTGWSSVAPLLAGAALKPDAQAAVTHVDAVLGGFAETVVTSQTGAARAGRDARAAASALADRLSTLTGRLTPDRVHVDRVNPDPNPSQQQILDDALASIEDPKLRAALEAALGALLHGNKVTRKELDAVIRALRALKPFRRTQVLGQLTAYTALGRLNGVHASATERSELYTLLLQDAPKWAVGDLEKLFPGMQPGLGGDPSWLKLHLKEKYGPIPRPVLDPGGTVNARDLRQTNLSDCYYDAPLIGLAMNDPGWVASHIHDNGNGTSTVTLYEHGKPVQVTVSNTIPEVSGGKYNGKGDGTKSTAGSWPDIYEKAYAQLNGSYAAIDRGSTADAMATLTGQPVHSPTTMTVSDLRTLLAENKTVCVSTNEGHGQLTLDNPGLDLNKGHHLEGNHVYTVQSVNADGTVTLRNPYGSHDCPTLTMKQILDQGSFDYVSTP